MTWDGSGRRHVFVFLSIYCVTATSLAAGSAKAGNVSVSGISAGGFFSVQMHIGFSSTIIGAGIVAGGPYWCSQDNLDLALALCENPNLINLPTLVAATTYAANLGSIDKPSNLAGSRVWLFSGTLDTVVNPGVVKKLEEYYLNYISPNLIQTTFNISAEHAKITDNFGNACSVLDPPFINNCNFDAAGAILSWIYDRKLQSPGAFNASNIVALDQAAFIPPTCPFPPKEIGLLSQAYAYVPTSCQSLGSCALHVAFHGCQQTVPDINDTFYSHAGYNQWAETNNFVILYPQAQANDLNPKGCFDWWGYSGSDFATRLGYQMATVKNMIDYLTQKYN